MADHLAIYHLNSDDDSVSRLASLGQRLFNIGDGFQTNQLGSRRILRSGNRVVEFAGESGGTWSADESQLWNPDLRPRLLAEREGVAKAERVVAEQQLLPKLNKPFRFGKPTVGGTHISRKEVKTGKREDHRLDVQVTYPIYVGEIPIVGGGGDFKLTLGHEGSVIAYSGVWRGAGKAFDAEIIGRKQADERFRALTHKLKIESFDATLAYYSAPASQRQDFLYPVYVYRATAIFGDQRVPLRQIIIPATDFGPLAPAPKPQRPRKKTTADFIRRVKRTKKGASIGGQEKRAYAMAAVNPFEAGTSWIGLSGGLSGSQSNAQGFIDEWANAGWTIDFNWGDANAWESDWTSNDDNYVDNADFVFYTGHANMNGWVLANTGGDGFLNFSETGAGPETPGDLWGQNDLEWAVIAACGPLQDDLISSGGGDVFRRWGGAFDGLHILMGYGAITYDNTDEGRKIAQYAKGGSTLVSSWFRAAQEIQPATNGASPPDGPNISVGAMWVGKNGADPSNDHAWNCGSVSADPTSPTWYSAMWTTC
jgi:hypothetical protein